MMLLLCLIFVKTTYSSINHILNLGMQKCKKTGMILTLFGRTRGFLKMVQKVRQKQKSGRKSENLLISLLVNSHLTILTGLTPLGPGGAHCICVLLCKYTYWRVEKT